MADPRFQFDDRFREFGRRLKAHEHWRKTGLAFAGWLVSFLLYLHQGDLSGGLWFFFAIPAFILWIHIGRTLSQHLCVPVELLIALFFLLSVIDLALLGVVYGSGSTPGTFLFVSHLILVSLQSLCFGIILVHNSKGDLSALFWFVFVAAICISILDVPGFFRTLIVQVILFVLLLRSTRWLEELTQIECWIYLVLFYFLFRKYSPLSPFDGAGTSIVDKSDLWYALPKFLFYLFKIYLLAVLVKIPVVLIYNFASLSRKLRISSFFQSTFPQFIQLVMLLAIFYFFIGGWQAEKVHTALLNTIDDIEEGLLAPSNPVISVPLGGNSGELKIAGYQSAKVDGKFADEGIVTLERDASAQISDPFLFFKSSRDGDQILNVIPLDDELLREIADRTHLLTGSRLVAYSYDVTRWESFIYNLIFWQDAPNLFIFPFAFRPHAHEGTLTAALEEEGDSDILASRWFTLGRVITPLLDSRGDDSGFFAFEVLVYPSTALFTPTLLSYVGLLALLYFLANILTIRRMTKFGSEINRTIVDKFAQLREGIREISAGNLEHKVKLEGKDEFVELGERFNQMGDRLKESIEEAREKERLTQELKIARQVQLDLLPKELPDIPGYEIRATLQTANEVGGDFYDLIRIDDEHFLFTIGDVSGKSTSAAFYMAQCISLIRYSHQFTQNLKEIAARLNTYFSAPQVDKQIFVTVIIGIIDTKKGQLSFVRAGHTPPLRIPGKKTEQVEEIESAGLGVGLEGSGNAFTKNLEEKTVSLHAGESMLFYTDGLVEAQGGSQSQTDGETGREFYGEERLKRLATEMRGEKAEAILSALTEDIESFYRGQMPVDDYTLLLIQKVDN